MIIYFSADEEKEKIGPAMPKGGTTVPLPPHTSIHQTTSASTLASGAGVNKPPLPAATTAKNVPPVPKPPVPPPPRPQTQQVGPPAPPMMMMTPPQPPPMRPVMGKFGVRQEFLKVCFSVTLGHTHTHTQIKHV